MSCDDSANTSIIHGALAAKVGGNLGILPAALIALVSTPVMLGPTKGRSVPSRVSRAQVGARLDEHLDRLQGARAHGVMKGGGVRVEIRAGAVQLDSEIDHPPQGGGPAAVRRQDKPELPVPGARCTRKTSNIVPTPEQECRRQGQRGSALDEVLGGREVAVDKGILRISVGRRAGIDQYVNEFDLGTAIPRNP